MIYYISRLKKTTKFINEVWLSLVEHYVRDVGAASSNLVTSTNCRRLNYEKKLVIQPFFVTWGVLRKTGFFPKWQAKWQVKWQVGNGQFVPVVGIFRADSVVQSRKKANGFEQKHEKRTAYRPRHYTSSLSESKAIPCKVTRRSLCGIALK